MVDLFHMIKDHLAGVSKYPALTLRQSVFLTCPAQSNRESNHPSEGRPWRTVTGSAESVALTLSLPMKVGCNFFHADES